MIQPPVVNVRQPGFQSRQLIHIRDGLNEGLLITHILNIRVSNEPSNINHARSLRNLLKIAIYQVPWRQTIAFNQQAIPAMVTWVMPGVRHSSAYYYTATYLNDLALAQHTRLALSGVCSSIRQQHPEFGDDWDIVYLITKPLEFLNQQMNHGELGACASGRVENEEDNGVEDDEEEEEEEE